MNKSSKDLLRPLAANNHPAEGLQPTVAPLDDPSPFVPSHLAPILVRRDSVIAARRDNRLDVVLHQQCSHRVAVISPIPDQPLRLTPFASADLNFSAVERRFNELHLRRGSLLQVYSEPSTRAIGQYHKLCSLAAFSLSDQRTPFFARINIPSMKHSFQRTFCWSDSWSRNARQRFRSSSLSAHSLRRRWSALFEPYLSRSSLQGAPIHRIHRMPSKHLRSSSGGRPPLRERLRVGKCSLMDCPCLSVTARQAMDYLLDLVSYSTGSGCQPV